MTINSTCTCAYNLQVYTRLNHLNVSLSYNAVLKLITEVSERHKATLKAWLQEGASFKFVGDNVDKRKGVRDIRSDNHGKLKHMFSLIAVKARVTPPSSVPDFVPVNLSSLEVSHFLPTNVDVEAIQKNLVVLVSRILCDYIQAFCYQKHLVAKHIPHSHSKEMAKTSKVVVVDVLHKNENKSSDMVEIMRETVSHLGERFKLTVLSGGDHVTCEREQACKRHVMCANTPEGRLEQLESCVEDWHCLMSS